MIDESSRTKIDRRRGKVELRPPVKTSGADAEDTRRWAAVA